MLPLATRRALDRLITAVMTLIRAVAPNETSSETPTTTPTLREAAAQMLFFRLNHLLLHLIRITHLGVRTSPKPTPKIRTHPAPTDRPTRPPGLNTLPRRPGWLLAALPDIASPIAADIAALLTDPAIATLLARTPSLHRTLRPLLRSLGLEATAAPTPNPTPPNPTPPDTQPPPNQPPTAASRQKFALSQTSLSTPYLLLFRNNQPVWHTGHQ